DLTGWLEILYTKHLVEIRIGPIGGLVADDQRGGLRTQEAGSERGGAGVQYGRDAHEARQRRLGAAQFFRQRRSNGRVLNRPLRPVAGPQVISGPVMITLPAGHRADQGEMLGLL